MWIAYSKKGTRIESHFWDWCCMSKIMQDYIEELGLSEEKAYFRFWEDVKNSDPEDFSDCLRGGTLNDAILDGYLDEARASYLLTLDIECEYIAEEV